MGVLDTDFDNPDKLLAVVGSFWRNVYEGNDLVASVLHARAQLDAQAHLDLLGLVASISRFTVPVFHTRNWTFLRLLESKKDATEVPRYGAAGDYAEGTAAAYGSPAAGDLHAWALPAGFEGATVVLNRITDASLTLTQGVDFTVGDGVIRFRADPFADDRVAKRDVIEHDTVVDREAGLWAYRGVWDWDTVYRQFGYAVGLRLKSSEGYKALVNAVFDSLVRGTTVESVEAAFSAVCDVPLARGYELVEEVWRDDRHLWVATDANCYRFGRTATPTVAAGDRVISGQPLTAGLRFVELNRGDPGDALRAVACGPGLLAAGFHGDLMFEDKEVPLVVTEEAGVTRVSWELVGFPGDVAAFFDRVHAAGVAAGKTLAQLLDTRPEGARDSQPPPAALPETINPLRFLCANVLRNNAFAVRLRPAEFGPAALGLGALAQVLRRIVPPQTLCLVVAELSVTGDAVTMGAAGTDREAGGVETVSGFTGASVSDELTGDNNAVPPLVVETIRGRQITGRCE